MAITIAPEFVSPEKARALLSSTQCSGFTNRTLSEAAVNRYSGDMLSGEWFDETAEPIRIASSVVTDEDGKVTSYDVVIDGQHRLHAIIRTGVGRTFFIARNVPMAAFQYLDQGTPRSLPDLMVVDGSWGLKTATVATAGRMLWKHHVSGDPRVKPSGMLSASEGAILDYLNQHHRPGLIELWREEQTRLRRVSTKNGAIRRGMGPASVHLYLQYLWRKIDPTMADEVLTFLEQPSEAGRPCPHRIWHAASGLINQIKAEAEAGMDKVVKGRHMDFVNGVTIVCWVAWRYSRGEIHKNLRTPASEQKMLKAYVYGQKENAKGNLSLEPIKSIVGTV